MLHSAPTGSMCVVQRNKVGREWSWRLVCGRFFPSYDANSVHGGVGFHQNAFAHIAQTINSKPTYGRSPLCTPTIKNKAINPAEERPKDPSTLSVESGITKSSSCAVASKRMQPRKAGEIL